MEPVTPDRHPLRVALFGLGTVGRPVAARLVDDGWRAQVAARGVTPPELVAICELDPERPRGLPLPPTVRLTDDLESLASDPGVDIVVELIGGTGAARRAIDCALTSGKHVVTANKALLAVAGPDLEPLARDRGASLRFEAAVGGGIPLLGPLVRDLAANRVDMVRGIVNGTTNHILTAMAKDARAYADVLAEAQQRGFAEADPTADVCGFDAAHKLAILVRLLFGDWPDMASIRRSAPAAVGEAAPGITCVQPRELARAADLGLTLKLVAHAERSESGAITGAVTPAAVPATSLLGQTGGVTNAVEVIGAPVGRVAFRGPGAGGEATSSAVLADLLALARGEGSTWDPLPPAGPSTTLADDIDAPRAWFFAPADLLGAKLPGRIADSALVNSDEAIVTRPMALAELRSRLADFDYTDLTLYPVLEMGSN